MATGVPEASCLASTTSPDPPEPRAFSSVYPGTLHPATPAWLWPLLFWPGTTVPLRIGRPPFHAAAPGRDRASVVPVLPRDGRPCKRNIPASSRDIPLLNQAEATACR